ncbi:unnamed protein product [Chironomus riparius]|uniref:Gamma-interferon inducible lysosomal thiol reductase n=1 Tax=Chironomus riparius TaxID=315576 RepID=A0A9N9S7Z0_9DIPT|nr:unnamed protein product [Chironomus riparius]
MFSKIFIFFVICVVKISSAGKLKVTIYYESECRFSKEFIQSQLKPNYYNFKDYVNFVYVPFGKSSHTDTPDGKANFTCQHGPLECYGNVWELCALDMIGPDQDRQTAFVICDMNPDRVREQCTIDAGLKVPEVQYCVESRGYTLELLAEQVTAPILAQSGKVPTIVYNDIFNMTEYGAAFADFQGFTKFKILDTV